MKDVTVNLKAREHSWSGDWQLIALCIRLWIVPVFVNWLFLEIKFYKSWKKILLITITIGLTFYFHYHYHYRSKFQYHIYLQPNYHNTEPIHYFSGWLDKIKLDETQSHLAKLWWGWGWAWKHHWSARGKSNSWKYYSFRAKSVTFIR